MPTRSRPRLLLALFFAGLLTVPAGGEDVASWFAADPRAAAYTAMRIELQGLVEQARLQNVPTGPLIDKLREGAAKGVAGDRLLDALRDTIEGLIRARSILERACGTPAGGAFSEEDVQGLSLQLLRGLPDELAGELIAYGLQAGRPMRVIRAACDAVTSLLASAGLGGADGPEVGLKIGALLLGGRLSVSAYEALPSVYLKARAAGLKSSEILNDLIIGTLQSGGGVAAMNQKINRGQAAGKKPGRPPRRGPPDRHPGQTRPDIPDRPDRPQKPDTPHR